MIKATKPRPPATLTISDKDVDVLRTYIAKMGDAEGSRLTDDLRQAEREEEAYISRAERHEHDALMCRQSAQEFSDLAARTQQKIDMLPPTKTMSAEEMLKEIRQVAGLSWVESVEMICPDIIRNDEDRWLKIITRPDALFTTLSKRISSAGRFYRTTPYSIALPAYEIRLSMRPMRTASNNIHGLIMRLADFENDTNSFMEDNSGGYRHETHAHWGTRERDEDDFSDICLGEYESDVTRAFRKSLVLGLTSLAIYLQTSGDKSAYVSREKWALYLGKKEYNAVIVPRTKAEKEKAESADSDDDEITEECREGEHNECEGNDDDHSCSCICHDI